MAHKVNLYDPVNGWSNGTLRPYQTLEFDDPDAAIAAAIGRIRETGSISAACITADCALCADLPAYFKLTNAIAKWLAENPIDGSWMGILTEDPEHWAEIGVKTPLEMEKYLLLTEYSDYHKSVRGFRPRGDGFTMATPIEKIQAAWDALARSEPQDEAGIDQGETSPEGLLAWVVETLRQAGRDAVVHLNRDGDGTSIDPAFQGAGSRMPEALAAELRKLAPALIRCEIADFDENYRLSGRLMIDRRGDVFLDAEDFEQDWDYQRSVDTEMLTEMEFEPPADAGGALAM
ncbi:hypothetical protein [Defluviimonas salinarum]|uniref:Uncharacterized protein n=1 Tax=Defluviimonas salinarum TaxID=2992147 RepID=A0ABT3J9E7_9RHOB|nr:hypothetical protein [Defluviimonas salinarum]MCW3784322.1 hypothetical protein [Defluviimonas salinarum]